MRGIGNLRGGQQVSARGNLKGHSRKILGIGIGMRGIGNLRNGQQVSERSNLKSSYGYNGCRQLEGWATGI